MRISKLVLTDFGVYRGVQTIDLAPRIKYGRQRPIVLIGGHNGAGKTTILDAVLLCLYGRLALGNRVTDAEYSAYLREHIHVAREALIQPERASVSVEFEYSRAGETATYAVTRCWGKKGAAGVDESLIILRNGEPLDEVEAQFWPDFIKSMIPPGVSQLFFFDGEKIKRLAEGHTEAEALSESIKALLGLDLVERLQTDLDIYCARQVKKTAIGEGGAVKLGPLEKQEQALSARYDEIRRHEQDLSTRLQLLDVEIGRAEQSLAQGGHGLASQRGELKQRKADLETRISASEASLREVCDGPLPILLCRKLCDELLRQLEMESELARSAASRQEIGRALAAVEARLLTPRVAKNLGLGPAARKMLSEEVKTVEREFIDIPRRLKGVRKIHGLSDGERSQIVRLVGHAVESVPTKLRQLTKELARMEDGLHKTQRHLNRMPDSEELAPLVKKLSSLQGKHGECVAEMGQLAQERGRIENELAALRRTKEKLLAEQAGALALDDRVSLAYRTRNALDEYLKRLTEAKVEELQGVVLECFRRLCRKTDLVASLRIDPNTYEVSLADSKGRAVPREALSAGEKQIFAISLLWSLAKVSGRPLPMIVDTPLGRLDSFHRRNLVEHYFPVASHQVIVLSTDTEVDRECFKNLRSSISHAVSLVNHDGMWTEARSGYFWQEEPVDAGSAA